jgi:AcrR family transcriptional regulator
MWHTLAMAVTESTWTPNQQAARDRIIHAAADLIGRDGLGACTLRAVADEAGLKKSTVHYYFDDANELVDLSVAELFGRFARQASTKLGETTDAVDALAFLVRLFMGRASTPPPFRDGGLWPEYIAHALKRGAHDQIHVELEIFRAIFDSVLRRNGLDDETARARSGSVHDFLLGAMVRNMVQPIPRAEVARAVSAITGIDVDPARC